jgi:hypothetical protein
MILTRRKAEMKAKKKEQRKSPSSSKGNAVWQFSSRLMGRNHP